MSKYTDAVEAGLKGLMAVSSGVCPGCDECPEEGVEDEASFSSRSCGICNSHLGGDRYVWHALYEDEACGDDILQFDDACTDCVMFIANGDEPESWA